MVPGGGVRYLFSASPNLKSPAIPPFYKIVAYIKSANLVYSSTGVTGAVALSALGFVKGARAGRGW